MTRMTFFRLMEASDATIKARSMFKTGRAAVRGIAAKHGGKIAAGAGLAALVAGGKKVMGNRATQAAEAAEHAAKPLSRLKAAGKGAMGMIKRNPKAALAAGAAGLGSMMFMRKKPKHSKRGK